MLRPEFLRRKLQLITDDLGHLDRYRDVTHEALVGDFVALATVERLLERIVMRAIDVNQHIIVQAAGEEIPERTTRLTYRDSFLLLAERGVYPETFAETIAASAGLRNTLVHDYNDTDRRLVHASIHACLDQYPRYVRYLLDFLDSADADGCAGRGSSSGAP
ncbi:MAG TPA: HepT-like ribonuclease domain-containing protein [Longimicrobiaceae bacterium]|nr:HepT-like ribonuclease domain-containing protein [Longimicrobiaceae bacterium]